MSHSKRNTSRPVFTAHERAMARANWGSSSARLSRESFLPFASCYLCLATAIDPVACSHGDLFCRECALSNILAQKQEIRRLEKAREQEAREALEERARQDAEARERAVRDFELTQAGLSVARDRSSTATTPATAHVEEARPSATPELAALARGEKRKFSLDEDEVARIAEDERAKARKAISDEKASKPVLPSFWTPSVTPSSNKNNTLHEVKKATKSQPVCPASTDDNPHYYSLRTLVTVNFAEEKQSGTASSTQRICPSCSRGLSNSSRAMLAKPCGHVICRGCVDQFMRPSGRHDPHAPEADPEALRCYVCDADLRGGGRRRRRRENKDKEGKERVRPGLVDLRSEGTGFSAGGVNQVQRTGMVFQC